MAMDENKIILTGENPFIRLNAEGPSGAAMGDGASEVIIKPPTYCRGLFCLAWRIAGEIDTQPVHENDLTAHDQARPPQTPRSGAFSSGAGPHSTTLSRARRPSRPTSSTVPCPRFSVSHPAPSPPTLDRPFHISPTQQQYSGAMGCSAKREYCGGRGQSRGARLCALPQVGADGACEG